VGYIDIKHIASVLATPYFGENFRINGVCSVDSPTDNCVAFVSRNREVNDFVFLNTKTLFIVEKLPTTSGICSFIVVNNPRSAFAKISSLFLDEDKHKGLHELSCIARDAHIGKNVTVGPFSVVSGGARIGDNVVIENNVTIEGCVSIGSNSRIKSNSVIGNDGFGFEFSEEGFPIRIHHFGDVVIGEHVEIGSNSVVCRGTIGSTIISNHVKVDDHVFIAHNVRIGERSLVIAGTEISGSVNIGSNCWISPQVTILNKVSIGDGALVGIGSVVIRDVESGTTVAGNPARVLPKSK
jgi:UDP-3-O-[3-hydroxymyristoyl] glucosamine N-acyltransferase LpxD